MGWSIACKNASQVLRLAVAVHLGCAVCRPGGGSPALGSGAGSRFFGRAAAALVAKHIRDGQRRGLTVHATSVQTTFHEAKLQQDYAATASDTGVLQRPLKEELTHEDVLRVFGFPRNLRER